MQHYIDGHAIVLSDYVKTGASNILKTAHVNCHHIVDMPTTYEQNHRHPAVLNCPYVRWQSMFT